MFFVPLVDEPSHQRLNRSNFLNSLRNLTSSDQLSTREYLLCFIPAFALAGALLLYLLAILCCVCIPALFHYFKFLGKELFKVVKGLNEKITQAKLFLMKKWCPKLDEENSVGMNAEDSNGTTGRKDDTLVPTSSAKTFYSFEILESDPAPDYSP